MTNLVTQIVAFENGELSDDEVLAFFQEIVNTGLVWRLQGSYGRFAERLIAGGLIQEAPLFWEERSQ